MVWISGSSAFGSARRAGVAPPLLALAAPGVAAAASWPAVAAAAGSGAPPGAALGAAFAAGCSVGAAPPLATAFQAVSSALRAGAGTCHGCGAAQLPLRAGCCRVSPQEQLSHAAVRQCRGVQRSDAVHASPIGPARKDAPAHVEKGLLNQT